jgi:hypothetical protein
MPTLQLTDDQIFDLVKQMSPEKQRALTHLLLTQQWPAWADGAAYAAERARTTAAARGRNWDAMSEQEREAFVDEIVHEDHQCSG